MIWTDISDELLDMLEPYSEWFFKQDLTPLNKLAWDNPKNTSTMDTGCSNEYLDEVVEADGRHEGLGPEAVVAPPMGSDGRRTASMDDEGGGGRRRTARRQPLLRPAHGVAQFL